MAYEAAALVNWADFAQARAQLGDQFVRILGYFREDGVKSISAVEDAMRNRDAAALVRPAHTLKGESLQFGGERLGLLAEHIEHTARRCVETHESPDELLEHVVKLRPLFNETVQQFEGGSAAAPVRRPVVFGRKAG